MSSTTATKSLIDPPPKPESVPLALSAWQVMQLMKNDFRDLILQQFYDRDRKGWRQWMNTKYQVRRGTSPAQKQQFRERVWRDSDDTSMLNILQERIKYDAEYDERLQQAKNPRQEADLKRELEIRENQHLDLWLKYFDIRYGPEGTVYEVMLMFLDELQEPDMTRLMKSDVKRWQQYFDNRYIRLRERNIHMYTKFIDKAQSGQLHGAVDFVRMQELMAKRAAGQITQAESDKVYAEEMTEKYVSSKIKKGKK